jgi:hypothetical protein
MKKNKEQRPDARNEYAAYAIRMIKWMGFPLRFMSAPVSALAEAFFVPEIWRTDR